MLVPLAGGVVLLAATVAQQRRTKTPLLDWSRLGAAPIPVAMVLQSNLGFSAGTTGALLVGATVAFIVVSPLSGRVAGRVGVRLVASIGLLVAASGLVLLSTIDTGTPSTRIVVYLAFLGIGLGSAMPPVNAGAMAAAGHDTSGGVSGALTVVAQVAAVLGVAVVGGIAITRIGALWDSSAGDDASLAALRSEVVVGDIAMIRSSAGAAAAAEAQDAYVGGVSGVLRIGAAGLVVGAVVAALGLPGGVVRTRRATGVVP